MSFKFYKTYVKSTDKNEFVTELEELLPYKLSFLLKEANKILRYEMSFTSTYISTLYKRSIFRSKCPNWKQLLKSHNLIKRYDLLISQRSNKVKDFKRIYNITSDMRIH